MTTNEELSKELYNFIVNNRTNEVRLVVSKIAKMLEKDLDKENYEDCVKIRDMKDLFEKFLNDELTYDDIKEDLSFAKDKFENLLNDLIIKAKNKKK